MQPTGFIPSVPPAIPPSLLLGPQWDAWWSYPSAAKAKMTWVLAGNIWELWWRLFRQLLKLLLLSLTLGMEKLLS